MNIIIRKAEEKDVEIVHKLIYKLAEYESISDKCTISVSELHELMINEKSLRALIAECDGEAVGMTTYYFFKIATFSGKKVLYIEDLFINESFRGKGVGTSIFNALKLTAKSMNCSRMEWKCLDWNADSIAFYEKMGGNIYDGWITYTLEETDF